MDKKEWFIDSHNGNIKDDYHFIEKIASGGFGIVYLAEHRKTGKVTKIFYSKSNYCIISLNKSADSNPFIYRREVRNQGHSEEES
jgi:serine/threonine protein kinase